MHACSRVGTGPESSRGTANTSCTCPAANATDPSSARLTISEACVGAGVGARRVGRDSSRPLTLTNMDGRVLVREPEGREARVGAEGQRVEIDRRHPKLWLNAVRRPVEARWWVLGRLRWIAVHLWRLGPLTVVNFYVISNAEAVVPRRGEAHPGEAVTLVGADDGSEARP